MLVDIVSKNGNLLLNVVQRPDGSLDPEVEQSLETLARWIAVHGEAIYGTRPWTVYGEGPVRAKGGHFKEDFTYTAKDIRFTTKGQTLYAIALGWPTDGRLLVRSLAKPADGRSNQVQRVTLLGHKGRLKFNQTAEGLEVVLPDKKVSDYTAALKINGKHFQPVRFEAAAEVIQSDAQGNLTLPADTAEVHGDQLGVESRAGIPNLGFWDKPADFATWMVNFSRAGVYDVTASIASPQGATEVLVEAGGLKIIGKTDPARDWDDFRTVSLGQLELAAGSKIPVKAAAAQPSSWKPVNLRWIKFTPVK
jgi:alpha-L-fucosidase